MKRTVCILSGASGSGKSTWAKAQKGAVIVSADSFFEGDGEYRFIPEALPLAHARCLRDYLACLQSKRLRITVDNMNCREAEIAPYFALAEAFGYQPWIVVFDGAFANVHGTPPNVVANQRRRLEATLRDLPSWWSSRVCIAVNEGRDCPRIIGHNVYCAEDLWK